MGVEILHRYTRAVLSDADLSDADLSDATLCGATIDGAKLSPQDIGGPGHILCALTKGEWATIQAGRAKQAEETRKELAQ